MPGLWAIVQRCLRDLTFSRFGTISACDGRTDGQTNRETHEQRRAVKIKHYDCRARHILRWATSSCPSHSACVEKKRNVLSDVFDVFTDLFSGPVLAFGRLCACVSVQQLSNEMTFDLDSARWFRLS